MTVNSIKPHFDQFFGENHIQWGKYHRLSKPEVNKFLTITSGDVRLALDATRGKKGTLLITLTVRLWGFFFLLFFIAALETISGWSESVKVVFSGIFSTSEGLFSLNNSGYLWNLLFWSSPARAFDFLYGAFVWGGIVVRTVLLLSRTTTLSLCVETSTIKAALVSIAWQVAQHRFCYVPLSSWNMSRINSHCSSVTIHYKCTSNIRNLRVIKETKQSFNAPP